MLVTVCGSVNVVESESEKVKRESSKNGCHVLCIQDALLSSSYMPLFHSFVFFILKGLLGLYHTEFIPSTRQSWTS